MKANRWHAFASAATIPAAVLTLALVTAPAPAQTLKDWKCIGKAVLLRLALILAFVITVIYSADALSPTADQKVCATLPANADVVATCTRIIEAPNSSTLDRAVSYTFRADAARADGNTAAAIADYNQALALMSTREGEVAQLALLVTALSGRGVAYRSVQNYDLSLHDFDQAIAIEPFFAE